MTESAPEDLPSPQALGELVKQSARDLGFEDCRIAAAHTATHAEAFHQWIADGFHGDMAWLERNPQRRVNPQEVLPGAKSIIVLGISYYTDAEEQKRGRIARYAWGDDYHDLVEKKLKQLNTRLEALGGRQRYYVDTGPVLERDYASDAGLGWNGKSTVQIHRHLGTWFFLAELLTTLEIPQDEPFGDHCGKCTHCIDACPTDAITEPHRVDARRCISYLTIEHRGPIPLEFRHAMGDRIYGCDDCLAVCPWNRFAQASQESAFAAREFVTDWDLRDYLALGEEDFRTLFRKSPIKRTKRHGFLRNVCVALGNVGTAEDLPALEKAAQEPHPLIAEHAQWAIEEIQRRSEESGRSSRASTKPRQRRE